MKYKILRPVASAISLVKRAWMKYITAPLIKSQMGHCGKNVTIRFKGLNSSYKRIFLSDNVFIAAGFRFISYSGNLIMKDHSNAATNFTVITGNHGRVVGRYIMDTEKERSNEIEKDIVIEEDVEIGSDVTLLAGVHLGRGCTVGSGSLVRNDIPPYAIAIGNPAKVIGFVFTPDQIIEHEKQLYAEDQRIAESTLRKNYEKYFLNKMKEVRSFVSITV